MNKAVRFACVTVAVIATAYFLRDNPATVIVAVFGFCAAATGE